MTDPQENKLSMYLAVRGVCTTHSIVWNGLPAFVAAFGEFEDCINRIVQARAVQEGNITGIAADKRQEKEEMIVRSVAVAGAVYAYGSATANNALKARVDYNPSGLKKLRDTELRDVCQVIHDAANDNLADLGDYGVDAAMLAELQNVIDDFAGLLAAPREAIVTRAEATSRLVELFAEADGILKNQMDLLTKQFEDGGAFYKQYQGARVIVDL